VPHTQDTVIVKIQQFLLVLQLQFSLLCGTVNTNVVFHYVRGTLARYEVPAVAAFYISVFFSLHFTA
jgi:hypothetical protein